MKHASGKIIAASVMLLILLSAMVGQKVHIYNEDPLHYAAFCGDQIPDNGATSQVVAHCAVDNYWFFPCICEQTPTLDICFVLLGRPVVFPVCFGAKPELSFVSLRAPPSVG